MIDILKFIRHCSNLNAATLLISSTKPRVPGKLFEKQCSMLRLNPVISEIKKLKTKYYFPIIMSKLWLKGSNCSPIEAKLSKIIQKNSLETAFFQTKYLLKCWLKITNTLGRWSNYADSERTNYLGLNYPRFSVLF